MFAGKILMATAMPHVDVVDDKPVVCLRAGASIVQTKPLFSHDSKCLFCGCGSSVKVYSTESGECIRQLQAHTDEVTGLVLSPVNKLQLLSCSLDAQVLFWDYTDGVMLKTLSFPQPLYGIVSVRASGGQFQFCVLQRCQKRNNNTDGQLVRYTVTVKDSRCSNPMYIFDLCKLDTKMVATGVKEEYYAAVSPNQKELLISHNKKCLRYKMPHNQLTCIAAHPKELSLATGCADGKIYFWYSFTNEKQMVKSLYHWHAVAVITLTFSPEGSYLLSGGHECTLVKWQYETHYKDFLPRLGSPLTHITTSPDNLLYAVAHLDNGIHLLSNVLTIQQIYQGLTRTDPRQGTPVGLLCDPRSGALVSNGKPGHLQFYCLHTDKQLFNLDIVQQNYISPENLKHPLTVTQITKAAIDERGDWLVTYQLWDDGEMSPEMQLKFWRFDTETRSYVMNTVVDRPHDRELSSLKLRPYSTAHVPPLAVTGGLDRKFKLWTLVDDTDIYRSNNKWTCDSVGFYRDMETGETAFAEDGSLLAVVFQSAITLWDPDTNILRTTLSNNYSKAVISHVVFGRDSCCHLLVSATEKELSVWNLLTCAVQWSVSLQTSVLIDDPLSKYMAVFTSSADLHVFEPNNPKPVFTQPKVSKCDIISAVFIPHKEESSFSAKGRLLWQRQSQLYFLSQNQELYTVQYQSTEDSVDAVHRKTPIKQNLPQSALSLIVSKHRKSASKTPVYEQLDMSIGSKEKQFVKQMLTASFVAQPPISTLCQTFLETRLSKGASRKTEEMVQEEEDDIDEIDQGLKLNITMDSESDMEVDNSSRSPRSKSLPSKQQEVFKPVPHTDEKPKHLEAALSRDYSWFESLSKS